VLRNDRIAYPSVCEAEGAIAVWRAKANNSLTREWSLGIYQVCV
jgi:hypothetical protein